MLPINDNPFAILSAIAAPAIMTNACSMLALGTANRIARVVDRSRVVMGIKKEKRMSSAERKIHDKQLRKLRRRGDLLLKALRLFYGALGLFAATALMAIIGSALAAYDITAAFHVSAILGFIIGAAGVIGVVIGCMMMMRETRLAVQSIAEEHDFVLSDTDTADTPVL